QLGDLLGGGVGVLEARGAGAGVGAAGVQHDGADPAALEDLLRPQHGRGLDAVAGEDAGGGAGRPVVDDEGDVAVPAVLEPGDDAGGAEALRGGDVQGETPIVVRPSSSGRPRARLALCTAPPAVPLVRLSTAATTTMRPASSSRATCTRTVFAPSVMDVAGHRPSGSSSRNGSPSYASA